MAESNFKSDLKKSEIAVARYIEFLYTTGRYVRVWKASLQQDKKGVDVFALTNKETGNFSIERHQVKANLNYEKYGKRIILEEYNQVFVDPRTSVNGYPCEIEGKPRTMGMLFEEELSCDYLAFYDEVRDEFLILRWCDKLISTILTWYELGNLKMHRNYDPKHNKSKENCSRGMYGDSWYSTWFFFNINLISEQYIMNW